MALLLGLELVLQDLGLDLEVGQLLSQPLCLYPEAFPLLLSNPDLLLHHDCSLDSCIILRLEIFQRRVSMPCLPLEVIICNFYITQPVLQCPVRVPQGRDLLL